MCSSVGSGRDNSNRSTIAQLVDNSTLNSATAAGCGISNALYSDKSEGTYNPQIIGLWHHVERCDSQIRIENLPTTVFDTLWLLVMQGIYAKKQKKKRSAQKRMVDMPQNL